MGLLLVLALGLGLRAGQPSGAIFGLLAIPRVLKADGVIDEVQEAHASAAVHRLASWRLRGALIGALLLAVPALAVRQALVLCLVAILAGATSGLAAAQWWRMSHADGVLRSASLERRTMAGLVGPKPILLLAVTTMAAAGASVGWWVQRSHTGDKTLVAGRWTCLYRLTRPSLFGPALGWVGAVLAVVIAVGAARATAHRSADPLLAEPVDLALRQAGIRTAFGCAITVTAGLAAGMFFVFRTLFDNEVALQGNCATRTAWAGNASNLLLFAGLVCVLIAASSLYRYLLFPGRHAATTARSMAA